MNLSVLEERLLYELPEEHHEVVKEEISRFSMEISRMSPEEDKIGQATLTQNELKRLPTTNQHGTEGFTTIQLQVIKACAINNGVSNWIELVDGELTYEENCEIIRNESIKGGQTLRELGPKVR